VPQTPPGPAPGNGPCCRSPRFREPGVVFLRIQTEKKKRKPKQNKSVGAKVLRDGGCRVCYLREGAAKKKTNKRFQARSGGESAGLGARRPAQRFHAPPFVAHLRGSSARGAAPGASVLKSPLGERCGTLSSSEEFCRCSFLQTRASQNRWHRAARRAALHGLRNTWGRQRCGRQLPLRGAREESGEGTVRVSG